MINIEIYEEDLIELLSERVRYWTDDEQTIILFEKMYENLVYSGCFEGTKFDVQNIVDNDYVNNCGIVAEGDEYYDEIKKAYDNGEYGFSNGYVEAEDNGTFLIRYC